MTVSGYSNARMPLGYLLAAMFRRRCGQFHPIDVPLQHSSLRTEGSPHNTLETVLEPLDRLRLVDLVRRADLALGSPALSNTFARSGPSLKVSVMFVD